MGTGAGPIGYTGEAGSCLWCGRKLRRYRWPDLLEAHGLPTDARGGYADGFFCGLRCGFEFGRELAARGRRLVVTR